LFFICHLVQTTGVVKTGGYRYEDGTRYIGDWNQKGQKHGMGHLLLPDGTRYGKYPSHYCTAFFIDEEKFFVYGFFCTQMAHSTMAYAADWEL
jgi:hypothetical protein